MFQRRKRPRRIRRSAAQRLILALDRLPRFALDLLSGGPIEMEGQSLDPVLAVLCKAISRRPPIESLPAPEARRRFEWRTRALRGDAQLMDDVQELRSPGRSGDIRLRVYRPPKRRPNLPALVYFHGGGWVLGDLDTHDSLCRLLATQTPCVVISVDYRLAPENPFPAAADDALEAFRHIARLAAEPTTKLGDWLDIDPERIAVGGDSAGGNLAAVVALETRHSDLRPCAQVLLYPVTDARLDTESYSLFAQGFGLSRDLMGYFFDSYLGPGHLPDDNPRISPLRADDLTGLPPTLMTTAGFDVLRDEGEAYAERLAEAGVEVHHRRFDSLIHGYANITLLPGPRRALDETISELAHLFHRLEEAQGEKGP